MDRGRWNPFPPPSWKGKMNGTVTADLSRIYKGKQIHGFEIGRYKAEGLTKEVLYQLKIRELAEKGLIGLASGEKVEVRIPPKLPGKPWSEILKEIRE